MSRKGNEENVASGSDFKIPMPGKASLESRYEKRFPSSPGKCIIGRVVFNGLFYSKSVQTDAVSTQTPRASQVAIR